MRNNRQGRGILSAIGTIFLVIASTAAVAVFVFIALDFGTNGSHILNFGRDAVPVFAPDTLLYSGGNPDAEDAADSSAPPLWPGVDALEGNNPPAAIAPVDGNAGESSQADSGASSGGNDAGSAADITSPPSIQPPPIISSHPQHHSNLFPFTPVNKSSVDPHAAFDTFEFYLPENAGWYTHFQALRPDLPAEDVVWMVNAHLHMEFYAQIFINWAAVPLMVNPFYRLPPGFSPAALVPVNSDEDIHLAIPEAVAAFRRMRESARAVNLDLAVVSAFRTAERQAELFEAQNFVDGVVARPYHSEHQTGRALDLWGPGGLLDASGPSPAGIWVSQNAHLYGFIIRYKAETTHITGFIHEPWHITYVGTDIATYMFEHNILSLEEFLGRNPQVR